MFNTAHCVSILPQASIAIANTTVESTGDVNVSLVGAVLQAAGPSSTTTILG